MQTQTPFFDALAKAMTEAAGAADGVRRETETMFRSQLQKFLAEQDMVPREEFEVVRDMLTEARAEIDELKTRVETLEKR